MFSVIDIIQVLTQQPDFQGARKYWKVLKGRLAKEGSELVTNCYQLKMTASDGKQRLTDVATAETQRLESLYQRKLTALDELKKSLLHRAFNGQL